MLVKRPDKRFWKRLGMIIIVPIALFLLLDWFFPVDATIQYAPLILDRKGEVLHAYTTPNQQWRLKTDIRELMPQLRTTVLYKEDKYFYYHPGINPFAIARAALSNVAHLHRTSGASTITMQVARMLDRKPRTYWNKLVEMFRALQLEKKYSKEQILELYLNLAPYGSNIQGVKAASVLYFNKTPDHLSLAELTALSIIPNRPNYLVLGKDNDRIVQERNKWLKRFDEAGLFPKEMIADALAEPLNAWRHAAPDAAPQFCQRMRQAYPQLTEIRTTIDAAVQQRAEDLTHNYAASLRLQNIYNTAVLITDTRTREVLAYIGSADFADKEHHGEVDGIRGVRSPGSALKPLLYGLAIDQGLLTPKTIIADVPINIKGYSPENYDLGYRGNVTVEDALRQSLNIPAVKTLDRLGIKLFADRLTMAGFHTIKDAQQRRRNGLSMILGGCGVQLDEMVALYSTLANEGRYKPLQYLALPQKKKPQPTPKGLQILSPAATYMVAGILRELHRPDLPALADQAKEVPQIAWKTGTSYGRKDAWSIGYNREYTIGVWAGNFDGMGAASLNGAGTATPLLFQLFNAIDHHPKPLATTPPNELGYRMVCPKTGMLPAEYCTDVIADSYIPGISPNEPCEHMQQVWVSADGQYSYCTSCLPATGYKTITCERIAPDLASWYDRTNIAYQRQPPHNPGCSRVFGGEAPQITSLQNGLTYLIADKSSQMLQLACNTAADVHTVYWYINDRFYQSAAADEKLLFNPASNEVKISCTDDKGRNRDIVIRVKWI